MVSVVIPVYNGAKYIEKTIRTILNSTYQNLEIIAVVDGSPDNSLAVCQKLSQEDARVKTFYKELWNRKSHRRIYLCLRSR